jgi:cation:H+ antiporter
MSFYLMLIAGFGLLLVGGETLVRGAVASAERLGMSSLLIGVVVVGFGTSMPELVTSVEASLAGSPGIAIGNIVGSNISNILLVLGLSALIAPFAINPRAVSRDSVFVVASTVLFVGIGFVVPLDRFAGLVLLAGLTVYFCMAYRQEAGTERLEQASADSHISPLDTVNPALPNAGAQSVAMQKHLVLPLLMSIVGICTLILGGKLLVDGARGLALAAGISEAVIGLTIVAIGTSAPEMVTCIIAALKRHGDVALGNVLGSCVYNLLAIGGLTAMVSPTIIPQEIVNFDNLVMLVATLLMFLFLISGKRLGRVQGGLLVSGYFAYLFWIWPM